MIATGAHSDPNRQAAGFLAIAGLPLIDLIVLIGTGLLDDTHLSLELFPLLFASLAGVLCRLLGVGFWWGATYTVGCAAACWMAAACAGILDSMFLPW